MLPHAPQFFTQPETEPKEIIAAVQKVGREIGDRLKALKPDLWIIFSNDHAEQFFHNAAPPFTIHVGGEARGEFAGRKFHWQVPSEIGFELVRADVSAGFRPGLHEHGRDRLRDRHSADASRHHRSGAADLRQRLSAAAADDGAVLCLRPGDRARRQRDGPAHRHPVVAAACRISRAPTNTAIPNSPGINQALAKLAEGNLKSLIGYDEAELDRTGNIELRCWACAAGAIGERKPDVVSMDPSWHHNYASLAWIDSAAEQHEAHYPSIKPELVQLTNALHGLAHDQAKRAAYLRNAAGYAEQFGLRRAPADRADQS